MVDQLAVLPGEGMVVVDGSLVETLRKLKFGDNILGWEGDPNMEMFVDRATNRVDVWTLGVDGEPALVVAQRPYGDQRIVEDVIRADNRRADVVGRIIKANEANEARSETEFRDRMAEAHDKLHFALLKDIGHLEGGLTRRLH